MQLHPHRCGQGQHRNGFSPPYVCRSSVLKITTSPPEGLSLSESNSPISRDQRPSETNRSTENRRLGAPSRDRENAVNDGAAASIARRPTARRRTGPPRAAATRNASKCATKQLDLLKLALRRLKLAKSRDDTKAQHQPMSTRTTNIPKPLAMSQDRGHEIEIENEAKRRRRKQTERKTTHQLNAHVANKATETASNLNVVNASANASTSGRARATRVPI